MANTIHQQVKRKNTTYFWKPNEENGFLGNWFSSDFILNDIKYCNVEQYFMHQKALQFNDLHSAELIMRTTDPNLMKRLGSRITPFVESIWDSVRYAIMKEAIFAKFNQNRDLLELLISTQDNELVEASPYDKIWGVGFDKYNANKNRNKWGNNLLGKALMEVRNELS